MKALTYTQYGGPEVVKVTEIAKPEAKEGEVLIRVHASAVTTGDWRIRAAAFPGIFGPIGRMMFGIRAPRNQRLGTVYAGTIEGTGPGMTRFQKGDAVFGMMLSGGASAEYITVPEQEAVAKMPAGLDFDEAAALPFGAMCALVFLGEFGNLKAGQRVLIVGASGGVGSYAVQIAKALGAHVTGVAGTDNQVFVKSLGADTVIDYKTTVLASIPERFDLIFDTVGALSPRASRRLLSAGGLFLPLNFGFRELRAAMLNPLRSRKIKLAVNGDKTEDLERVAQMVDAGTLRPIIDTLYPLEEARRAHAQVQARHSRGTVILNIAQPLNRAAA